MKKITALLLLSLLSGCYQREVEEHTMVDTLSTSSMDTLTENSVNDTHDMMQSDSLLFMLHDDLIDVPVSTLAFISEKKAVPNKHVSGQIDTIEQLTFKKSQVVIYRSKDKNLLISADIADAEISLSGGINIGMSRDELKNILHSELKEDALKIVDFEGNTNVILILKNDVLSRIIYSGYYD